MASQSAERRRCLSCNRWGGERTPGSTPDTVDYDEDNDRGPCQEGPWHGSSRRGPRNACGQWVRWIALAPPTLPPALPPAPETGDNPAR